MPTNSKTLLQVITRAMMFGIMAASLVSGQHRGDKLAFQGLSPVDSPLLNGLGLNGAYSSDAGDIRAAYLNPAGLASISGMQLYLSGGTSGRLWQENQVYRPNRFFVTLPYYLEGLYIPDPLNNGAWDHEIAPDTLYHVEWPELGLDPFGTEAADWQEEGTDNGLFNLAAAVPINLGQRQIALGLAYNRRAGLLDYDRNATYLDPHPGYSLYNEIERVNGVDTTQIDWYDFERRRSGTIHDITVNLAAVISGKLDLGISVRAMLGRTDDQLSLDKVGWFRMHKEQRFRFSYDTLATVTSGTSDISGVEVRLGGLLKLNKLNVSFSASLPQTITRSWTYTTTVTAPEESSSRDESGEDKLVLPSNLAFGLSFYPSDKFTFYMDISKLSTGGGEYAPAVEDTMGLRWVDSGVLNFGAIFQLTSRIDLRAGYHYNTVVFAPDGAAYRDEGPPVNSYDFGMDLNLGGMGKIFVNWSTGQLRYHDSYYSNTNYALENKQSMTIGYLIGL